MGILIRQSIKASVVSYVGAAIGAVSTIFIYPYFLTPELVGLNRILIDSAFLLAFFAQIGIPNAIIKFSPFLRQSGIYNQAYRIALIIPLISMSVFSIILISGKDFLSSFFIENSALFIRYFYLLLPFALVTIYLNILENFSTSYYRISIPKLIREILIRCLLIASAVLYFKYKFSVDTYVIMLIATYALALSVLFLYVKKLRTINFSADSGKFTKPLALQIFSFMGFMFFAGIGSNFINRADTFMISSLLDLSNTGIYSISFFMATMIELPSRAALQISSPFVSEFLERNETDKLSDLYKRYSSNQSLIGGLLLILLWSNIDSVFEIMPNGKIYAAGKYVVLFIGLGKLIDVSTGINNLILVYSKYYRYMLIFILLLGIITVVGNLFLIPLLGIRGAAIASLFAYFFINSVVIIFLWFKLRIHPFSKKSILIGLVIILTFIINWVLPSFDIWYFDLLFRSIVLTTLYVISIYYLKLSDDLQNLTLKMIDKTGLKKLLPKKQNKNN